MKTIKYLFFFGGFMIFFNFSHAYAAPVNGSQPNSTIQLRQQIVNTFSHTFYAGLDERTETVTVDFVVGPDNHLKVVELSGGSPVLRKLVTDKFAAIEANASATNERYTIQLTIKLI